MATTVEKGRAVRPLDVEKVRADFPALALEVYGKPLAYLDNAASAQKPAAVIDAEARCYREFYANVHRGVHHLSARATSEYEAARSKVARLLGASSPDEIVLLRGTTEAVNLVAQAWGRANVGAGDEILITGMEHHSNIVPWQMLCEEKGATLRVAPIDDRGDVIVEEFEALLSEKTKIASINHVSNALGTINPVERLVAAAKSAGAVTMLDGAQAVPHLPVDVAAIGCDFYAFSGHKFYGPSGIGALWGRREILDAMPPWQGGGEMIRSVRFDRTEYNDVPHKFEAGTPNIAGAIALGATVDYVTGLDWDAVAAHEDDLLEYATEKISAVSGVRLVGTARRKAAVVGFTLSGVHPHDIGTVLDREGVAVRAGHHCAQPVMERFGVPATVRASFGVYNTREEVDRLVDGLARVREVFA